MQATRRMRGASLIVVEYFLISHKLFRQLKIIFSIAVLWIGPVERKILMIEVRIHPRSRATRSPFTRIVEVIYTRLIPTVFYKIVFCS